MVVDAELNLVLRQDAIGKLQGKYKGVCVLEAVDIVQKGAVNLSEVGPRVKGDTKPHCLLKANVPNFDGASQWALLQSAVF